MFIGGCCCRFIDRIGPGSRFLGAVAATLSLFAAFMCPVVAWSAEPAAIGSAPTTQGSIVADTVWDGRLVVDGMVTVEAGATLTIRPGTEVRFAAAGGIAVNGVLRAEGAADKPILFLPAAEGQEPWAGITLGGTSPPSLLRSCRVARAMGITIGEGEHRVEKCDISGGPVGISIAGPGANPVITGNRITDTSEAGINCLTKSGPTVTDNVLERCGKVGIGAQPGATPQIRGNRVSGCESGIEVVQAPPRVSGNTVTGCIRGIALSSLSGGEPVRNNRVEGNETGILCQLSSAPEISGNTVVKNRDGIVCFRHAQPLLRANDILENETGIVCNQFSDATIGANTIARNGRGIFLMFSSFAVIHGNNLEDNNVQVETLHLSLAYERLGTDKPLRGRLQQNKVQVERGKALPLGTKDDGFDPAGRSLDLSGNWWGEATTREMEEKGPDANISSLSDGYDVPLQNGYPQEKIVYTPWAKQRIAATGVSAP
jgi:parallel beta-helix repeat protein